MRKAFIHKFKLEYWYFLQTSLCSQKQCEVCGRGARIINAEINIS
ncbi:Uncharacterised protein [Serratia quinivorans]|nr:Uncharacterised protein [Serratia quinivorans]CAI1252913.1 Uncharacterised protein [Serratia quinivorans]CAI2012162.1 Uncharacterised protein [Serratia quinivorans]CAI2030890.1 Uncharacterised protein [Serratia quinivorans]CAI2160577.1 Uncharacterised protein [Serratia quinivorans]